MGVAKDAVARCKGGKQRFPRWGEVSRTVAYPTVESCFECHQLRKTMNSYDNEFPGPALNLHDVQFDAWTVGPGLASNVFDGRLMYSHCTKGKAVESSGE